MAQCTWAFLTDLGTRQRACQNATGGLSHLLVEANRDPAMLAASRYPLFLQRRIAGPMVIANAQRPLSFGSAGNTRRLDHVVAAHLSAHNNTLRWRRRLWPAHWISRLSASA